MPDSGTWVPRHVTAARTRSKIPRRRGSERQTRACTNDGPVRPLLERQIERLILPRDHGCVTQSVHGWRHRARGDRLGDQRHDPRRTPLDGHSTRRGFHTDHAQCPAPPGRTSRGEGVRAADRRWPWHLRVFPCPEQARAGGPGRRGRQARRGAVGLAPVSADRPQRCRRTRRHQPMRRTATTSAWKPPC